MTDDPAELRSDDDSLGHRIDAAWDSLSKAERAVARVLMDLPAAAVTYASADSLAERSGTSNATVVRAAQKLGFAGLPDLKQSVAVQYTERVAPAVRLKDRLEHAGDSSAIANAVFAGARNIVAATEEAFSSDDALKAVNVFLSSGIVFTYGVGLSATQAEMLATRLGRAGLHTRHLDMDGFRLADAALQLREGDALVLFAPRRISKETRALAARASAIGARVVLISATSTGGLQEFVDVTLLAPYDPTSQTSETFASSLIVDILVQLVILANPDQSVRASIGLSDLRAELGYPIPSPESVEG